MNNPVYDVVIIISSLAYLSVATLAPSHRVGEASSPAGASVPFSSTRHQTQHSFFCEATFLQSLELSSSSFRNNTRRRDRTESSTFYSFLSPLAAAAAATIPILPFFLLGLRPLNQLSFPLCSWLEKE